MKCTGSLIVVFGLLSVLKAAAQDTIALKNPSFEVDRPATGHVPTGWTDVGTTTGNPVDIQPGVWECVQKPQDGEVYVGMVVRENNTWEGIGQQLESALLKDSSYVFSVWLSRAKLYKTRSPLNYGDVINFDAPTILKIWGYNLTTKQLELLAESQPVGSGKWIKYEFVLTPTLGPVHEIDLMAYYAPGFEDKNGNLLIDNCSLLVKLKK